MDKVRVSVVDDSPFIHRAVARAFKNEGRFELVGSAYNGKERLSSMRMCLFSTSRSGILS